MKKDDKGESPQDLPSPGAQLAKRKMDVKNEQSGVSSTSMQKVKIAKSTKLEDREQRDKVTIPIDSALVAFQQEIESALTNVDLLIEVKEAQDTALAVFELELSKTATQHITSATKIAQELAKKTRKTPYAFAGRQFQDIAATSLASATAELKQASTEERPLAPLQLAGSHLQTALLNLQALRKQYGTVKAEREQALALKEMKEMFVLYMEDMPLFLGGKKPSPYTRSMAEIDREGAIAMQEMLDRKVALNKKIAEILKDHPELQARLMSQKRDQAVNIRAALLEQQERQTQIEVTTKSLNTLKNDEEKSEAVFQFIQSQQEIFNEQLALFIDRSATWLPIGSDRNDPAIKDYLAATHSLSIQAQTTNQLVPQRNQEQTLSALDEFVSGAYYTEEELDAVSAITTNSPEDLTTYVANRRTELGAIISHQKQIRKDLLTGRKRNTASSWPRTKSSSKTKRANCKPRLN